MLISHKVYQESEVSIEKRLGVVTLASIMMNFYTNAIDDYDELVVELDRFDFCFKTKQLQLDIKNREPTCQKFVDESLKLKFRFFHPTCGMYS